MLDTLRRLEELSSHTRPLRVAREGEAAFGKKTADALDNKMHELKMLFLAGSILVIGLTLGFIALVFGLAPIVPPYMTAASLALVCIFLAFALALSAGVRG